MAIQFERPYPGLFYDKGGAVYNVRHPDFGAKGNGVANDAPAIQAAVDAAFNAGVGGATVYIPRGTYALDTELVARGSVNIEGAHNSPSGSVLVQRTANTPIFQYPAIQGAQFRNLCFHATALGVTAFKQTDPADYTAKCLFEDLTFRRELTECIVGQLTMLSIERCNFGYQGGPLAGQTRHRAIHSVGTGGANLVVVRDCDFIGGFGAPAMVHFEGGFGLEIDGGSFEVITGRALDILGMRRVGIRSHFENITSPYMIKLGRAVTGLNPQLVTVVERSQFTFTGGTGGVAIFDLEAIGAEISAFTHNTIANAAGQYLTHIAGSYNVKVDEYHHNEVIGTFNEPDRRNAVLSLRSAADVALPSGLTHNYDAGKADTLRVTGTAPDSAFTGFAGGYDGRTLRVVNVGAPLVEFGHQLAGSLAENRIITPAGTTVSLAQNRTAELEYDGTALRWRVVDVQS